jgi:hypothetical protein
MLPAILIRNDEDDGGNVTGPGEMPAGKAVCHRGSKGWPPLDRAGIAAACEVDAADEDPRVSEHGRGFE